MKYLHISTCLSADCTLTEGGYYDLDQYTKRTLKGFEENDKRSFIFMREKRSRYKQPPYFYPHVYPDILFSYLML